MHICRAADLLGVSKRTVYYWIECGKLRTMRSVNGVSVRVLIESIDDILAKRKDATSWFQRLGVQRRG